MNELLWDEYQLIYSVYESFDQQLLTLKGWSVSIGIAALIAAYTKPVSSYGRTGILIAAFSAIPFWLTETFWKLFQRTYLDRLLQIEECFKNNIVDCEHAQIVTAWQDSFSSSKWPYWFEGAFDLHVLFPHFALLTAGIFLAVWYPPRPTRPDDQ